MKDVIDVKQEPKKETLEIKNEQKNMLEKIFGRDEAMEECLKYFNGDTLAAEVWISKYAMKNGDGQLLELSPVDMHKRMAKEFSKIEKKYDINLNGEAKLLSEYGQKRQFLSEERIMGYFEKFKYIIPQGSVMASLGNHRIFASLSNCIVLPELQDSYAGICYADQQLVQLMKRRCGVGLDISTLRPEGMTVSNAAGSSTGAVSFMDRFSNSTREVAQSGRRGALMITMDINHPESEKFATIKQDLKKVTGANISLKLSDEFMNAVNKGAEYVQKFPVNSDKPKFTKKVKAAELWDTIVKCAHNTAEPGLIFWDRQHWYSTSSVYPQYKNISTNPCSEIAMGADSCRLIALNLFGCVKNPFTKNAEFDYEKLYEIAYEAQRLMDNLVDLELECIDRIIGKIKNDSDPEHIKAIELNTWNTLYESGKNGRRTGLGFTALADTMAALGYKFDSNKSAEIIEEMMKMKCKAEFDSSIDMAIERGKFVGFDTEIEKTSHFVQMLKKELPSVYDRMMKHGRRNVSISTVAPNGTLSIVAQTSSGIEPVFMMSYMRRKKINPADKDAKVDFTDAMGDKWQEFEVFHPKVKMWLEVTGKSDIKESPYAGATAEELDWKQRIKIQSIVQKYTTHSISSTINLPENIAPEKVSEIYMKSWEMGLKGITVYRSGSRSGVLISKEQKQEIEANKYFSEHNAPKRPKALDADVIQFINDGEKWIGFMGLLDGKPYEIFTGKLDDFQIPSYVESGKITRYKVINRKGEKVSRYDFSFIDKNNEEISIEGLNKSFDHNYWNYSKMISGILRHGMPLPYTIDLVSSLNLGAESLNTWKAGVARMIKKYIKDGTSAKDTKCPECGDEKGLVYEEGCLKCKSCGNSKCS
jgi:ribonucleoside-diphosphate reductase alpha chain